MQWRQLPLLLLTLLWASVLPVRAQEPTYNATLPGNQTVFLGLRTVDGPNGKSAQLFSRNTGGVASSYLMDANLVMSGDGLPLSCFSRYVARDTPHVPLYQEATRTKNDPDGRPVYHQQAPTVRGSLSFSGRVVNLMALLLFVGRIYDWQKGGEQSFLYLLDYGAYVPVLHPLKLTADGTEEIELESGKVKARRLKYRTTLPSLPRDQQTGKIYVGSNGETLWCPTALFVIPYKVKAPATYDAGRGTMELTLPDPLPVTVAAKRTREGIETSVKLSSATLTSGVLDARFNLIRIESLFPGRKMTAQMGTNKLNWELEATQPTELPRTTGNPFFFPQWFVTDTWESGNGPFSGMPVGEKRAGDYYPVYAGAPVSHPFTLERMEDQTAKVNGSPATVRQYRFSFPQPGGAVGNIYDAYTDGRRLIALLGATDGMNIRRDGWESFTRTLQKPVLPK